MLKILRKLLPIIIPLALFLYVLFYTKPPKSWESASVAQILSFFIPLLTFLTYLINIVIDFVPKSFILALGILILLVLQALNQLGLINGAIILVVVILLFRFFKRPKLTRGGKIPKLRL